VFLLIASLTQLNLPLALLENMETHLIGCVKCALPPAQLVHQLLQLAQDAVILNISAVQPVLTLVLMDFGVIFLN
jgi:hypothetical protein